MSVQNHYVPTAHDLTITTGKKMTAAAFGIITGISWGIIFGFGVTLAMDRTIKNKNDLKKVELRTKHAIIWSVIVGLLVGKITGEAIYKSLVRYGYRLTWSKITGIEKINS